MSNDTEFCTNLFYCFGSVSVTEVCTEIQSHTLYIGRVLQVIIPK